MAIEIRERCCVGVPIDSMWRVAASSSARPEAAEAADLAPADSPPVTEPVRIPPLLVRTLWDAMRRIAHKVGGLFGRRRVAEHPFAEKTSSER